MLIQTIEIIKFIVDDSISPQNKNESNIFKKDFLTLIKFSILILSKISKFFDIYPFAEDLISNHDFIYVISKSFCLSSNSSINNYLSSLILNLTDIFISCNKKEKLKQLQKILYEEVLLETIKTTSKNNTKDFYSLFVDILKKVFLISLIKKLFIPYLLKILNLFLIWEKAFLKGRL